MRYTDNFEKSLTHGRKALDMLQEHNSPATPPNYTVWYNYVAGANPMLMSEVDSAIATEGVLSQYQANRIYDEHFIDSNADQAVERLSAQMSGEVEDIVQMLESALGKTHEYGDSLGTVSASLDKITDSKSLKAAVQTLVKTTCEMQDYNSDLEKRLQDSRKQIDDLSSNLEVVRSESRTDQLTGIANRKNFDEMLEKYAREAAEEKTPFCLLLGDVDNFKKFNDTYGHQTGDQVLRFVAQALRANLKGRDLPARYGGEEFAVLLPQTKLADAVIVANQIRNVVHSKELIKKSTGNRLGRVTISLGAGCLRVDEDVASFVHRVDMCLYAAKNAGRNRVMSEDEVETGGDEKGMEEVA